MGTPKFCYSEDEGIFHDLESDTREAAIEEIRAMGLERAWIGEPALPGEPNINIDSVLDQLACEMSDQVGEASEDWPCFTAKEEKAMEDELNAVLAKHLRSSGNWPPSFYSVQNIEEVIPCKSNTTASE